MPGLIQNSMQQPVEAAPAQPEQQPSDPMVTRLVIAAKKILAMPQVAQHIVQVIKSAGDPAKGVAQGTIFLMQQVFSKVKGTIPPAVIPKMVQQVLPDVMNLGAHAGLLQASPDLIKQAVAMFAQMFQQSAKAKAGQQPAQPAEPAAQPAAPAAPVDQPAAQPMEA